MADGRVMIPPNASNALRLFLSVLVARVGVIRVAITQRGEMNSRVGSNAIAVELSDLVLWSGNLWAH